MATTVLALRPLCFPLRRHRSLDDLRSPDLARTSTIAILHQTPVIFGTDHGLPCTSAEPATTPGLFTRLDDWLQCAYACRHPPVFTNCRIRCRNRRMDRRRILVFLVDIRRPWRSRRTQRRQGEHRRRTELVGTMALKGTARDECLKRRLLLRRRVFVFTVRPVTGRAMFKRHIPWRTFVLGGIGHEGMLIWDDSTALLGLSV